MDSDIIMFLILFSPILLPLIFLFIGIAVRSSMNKSILEREQKLGELLLISGKTPPDSDRYNTLGIVTGNVVVGVDYFSTFLAKLKNIFGGNINSIGKYIALARRESILRLKEQAAEQGADTIINLRFTTSRISTVSPIIEITVYGTALKKR